MMKINIPQKYLKNESALVTTEFAVISFALLVMIFFVVELTALYFSIMSAQKAAQMGARIAIVSDPAATDFPAVNERTTAGIFGVSCGDASSPCEGFTDFTCAGGVTGCEEASFNRILSRMQQILGGLEAEHVTITYAYSGLGYAGGPVVPAVTVTVSGTPYNTGIIGGILGTGNGPFSTLPTVSVTLIGEDLSESGG